MISRRRLIFRMKANYQRSYYRSQVFLGKSILATLPRVEMYQNGIPSEGGSSLVRYFRTIILTTILVLGLVGLVVTGPAIYENNSTQLFADYLIHYNALTTEFLSPEISARYGVPISKDQVLVVISLTSKQSKEPQGGSKAMVVGTATDAIGQIYSLQFKEISDGPTTYYYLANLQVTNEEVLTFSVEATPEGHGVPYHVEFRQQFFVR
ncbi:hypothetical protein CCP3SC1_1610005 [Gammaproteobacteria bacterium]